MIAVEAFRPEHLLSIELQPSQVHMREHMTPEYLAKLAASEPCYTVRDGSRILACFGFYRWSEIAGIVWAYPCAGLGRRMIRVHRYAARAIDTLGGHIFAAVEKDFDCGYRWMDLLGFERIKRLDTFGQSGRPHDIYWRAN